ncbi:MAG: hypothetical protein F4X97_08560 [Boseongicola sp. SB0662_bin_57]|nr:hypothetical protein [Boseongicola sp. SB0662_bin_57]
MRVPASPAKEMELNPDATSGSQELCEGLTIYCADIGSVPNNSFGWARLVGDEFHKCNCIVGLVDDIACALAKQRKVALGFECPLWIPVPEEPQYLGKARRVDRDRSWSAIAGANVLATGTAQVAWILSELRSRLEKQGTPFPSVHLAWPNFPTSESFLFFWEAFVTGKAKSDGSDDAGDALIACHEFKSRLRDPAETLEREQRVRSLIGVAILWAGLSEDLKLLHMPCVVVRPDEAS